MIHFYSFFVICELRLLLMLIYNGFCLLLLFVLFVTIYKLEEEQKTKEKTQFLSLEYRVCLSIACFLFVFKCKYLFTQRRRKKITFSPKCKIIRSSFFIFTTLSIFRVQKVRNNVRIPLRT